MKTIKQLLVDADPLRHESPAPSTQRDLRREALLAASAASASGGAVGRLRFMRFVVVMVAAAAILLLGSRLWPRTVFESYAAVRFEVRLAEDNPGPGLREARIMGTDRSIFLHDEVVVSNGDIARAQIIEGNSPSQFSVGVEFTAEGARKMRAATEKHIGKRVAILVDDEVVVAPVVRSPIDGSAVINGNYTREQAERIVNGIGLQ